jgi:hypothetical protein
MMKKMLKPLLIGLAVLAAALTAGVLIYAQLSLTPKAIENTLSMEIQQQLRRGVSFRETEVGLFKGIILRGVTVQKGAGEKDDFFTCEELRLSFSFAPLLLRKLVIRSLECKNPRLHFQSDRGRPVRIYGTARPAPPTGPAFELLMLPGSVLVQGGALSFFDRTEKIDVQLANVQVEAGTISFIMPFDMTASASFENSATPDIQIKGTCFIPGKKFSAELAVPEFNFVLIRRYLDAFGIPLSKGAGSLNLTVTGSGDKPVQIFGTAALKDVAAVIVPAGRADDEIGIDGLGAHIEIQAEYDVDTGSGSIKKIQGTLLSSSFEGDGSIKGVRGNPDSVSVRLETNRLSLDELSGKMYYGSASPFKGLRLGGLMGLRVDLEGKADGSLFPTITANLYGDRIIYPPLGAFQPEFNGVMTLISRAISLSNLRIGTPNINVVLAGDIINYLQWPPEPNVRIVSSTFNLEQLVNDPGSMQGEDIGPFDFGSLKFEGPLDIGTVPLLDVELTNVKGAYLFENNRFSIKNFGGDIDAGGSFTLSSGIDLRVKGLEYNLTLSLVDVPLQTFNDLALVDLSRFIDGTVTGSASLGAQGTRPATFIDSLTGDAAFRIKDCRIKGFALPEQLDRFIKKGALTSLSFTDADLQLKLRGDAIELSGAFISPQAELHPSGLIGLNAELNMQAQLKLATDVFLSDTKIADYLPREGSWVVLPVVIKGTLDTPSVTLSDEAVRHIMQVTLPRLFMDMLEKARPEEVKPEKAKPEKAKPEVASPEEASPEEVSPEEAAEFENEDDSPEEQGRVERY